MMTYKEASCVAQYSRCAVDGFDKKRKLQDYTRTDYLNFEMMQVPAPEGYDDVLKSIYSDSYMTPVRGSAWHDYPFYKIQDRRILINNKLGQMGDVF
jgi:lipopolysaccharide cholinephosphotransferase